MANQTKMCGTLQAARSGNPRVVVGTKLDKGECISLQKDGITMLKWKNKHNVLMISTTNGPGWEQTTNKRGKLF